MLFARETGSVSIRKQEPGTEPINFNATIQFRATQPLLATLDREASWFSQ